MFYYLIHAGEVTDGVARPATVGAYEQKKYKYLTNKLIFLQALLCQFVNRRILKYALA